MAERWGNDDFARPRPYPPLVEAAAWHDEGWRPWEEAPEVDDDGAPVNFLDLDRDRHMALYRLGILRAAERSPRAGLLVSMHGQGLYEGRLGLSAPPEPRRAAAGRDPRVPRGAGGAAGRSGRAGSGRATPCGPGPGPATGSCRPGTC